MFSKIIAMFCLTCVLVFGIVQAGTSPLQQCYDDCAFYKEACFDWCATRSGGVIQCMQDCLMDEMVCRWECDDAYA